MIIDESTFAGDTRQWTPVAAGIFIPAFFIFSAIIVPTGIFSKKNILRLWLIELAVILLLAISFRILPN